MSWILRVRNYLSMFGVRYSMLPVLKTERANNASHKEY